MTPELQLLLQFSFPFNKLLINSKILSGKYAVQKQGYKIKVWTLNISASVLAFRCAFSFFPSFFLLIISQETTY